MFKLAHISDVHLHPLPKASVIQLANKRITGFLNWKFKRKHGLDAGYLDRLLDDLHKCAPDHTVITGDLVNLALPEEIENAGRFLEALGPDQQITAQFGNHDAYVPGALAKAIARWQPYVRADDLPMQSTEDFPALRIRDDIAIITCNSAIATLPFFATGYFRERQASRLADILERTKGLCRIVCIHHPPVKGATHWHKRLIGEKLFQRTLKQHGAELVLHGHTHLATVNAISGPSGDIPVVCVPAAANGYGNSKPPGRYNIYSISKSGNSWQIRMDARACSRDGSCVETVNSEELAFNPNSNNAYLI